MPYHLEKGPTIRVLEQHLNGTAAQRRAMLSAARSSVGSVDWLVNGIPGLWSDTRFTHSPLGSGEAVRDALIQNWLGFQQDPAGTWAPAGGTTTGYWVAYQGNVNEIVRRTVQWALEVSLGLAPGAEAPGRDDPWPIEVFWKCPTPWFEGWVVTRPVPAAMSPDTGAGTGTVPSGCADPGPLVSRAWEGLGRLVGRASETARNRGGPPPGGTAPTPAAPPAPAPVERGLVTIIFMSPSHIGANVAESPIAHSPTTMPPGVSHAIPSWQDDYEVLGEAHPDPTGFPGRPRVPANERRWATWVVTHRDHHLAGTLDVTANTAVAADFADWGIPQLGIYAGEGDVVVVAPSVPAGGVPHDGEV
jgi:hypothetical protein